MKMQDAFTLRFGQFLSGGGLLLSSAPVLILTLLALLMLSACAGSLPRPPQAMQTYDFGVVQPEFTPTEAPEGGQVALVQRPTVVIHPITAPRKLAGQAMLYRLAYQDRGALRPLPYSQSRWADAPASLLQALLQAQLSSHYSVLSPVQKINMTAHTEPALQLRIELLACSQVFYRSGTEAEDSGSVTNGTAIERRRQRATEADSRTNRNRHSTEVDDDVAEAETQAGALVGTVQPSLSPAAANSRTHPVSEAVLQVRVVIARSSGARAQLLHNRVLTIRVPAGNSAATGAVAMQQAALQLAQQLQALLATT